MCIHFMHLYRQCIEKSIHSEIYVWKSILIPTIFIFSGLNSMNCLSNGSIMSANSNSGNHSSCSPTNIINNNNNNVLNNNNNLSSSTETICTNSEQPDPDYIKMFVGQVPKSMDEDQLREMFEEFGRVHSINVLRDKVTGVSKGESFEVTKYWDTQTG